MRAVRSGRPPEGPREGAALLVCLAIPALVIAASFCWLALDHGTVALWGVVVHESGRYTLGETVFYFSHFLREVPIAVAYVLFLLGSSGAVRPGWVGTPHAARGLRWSLIGAAGLLVVGALIASGLATGWRDALLDLVQYRTRDDLVGYGTHWRYHWLSTLWFGAAAGLAPRVANRLAGKEALGIHRRWTTAGWGYFLALTVVFGVSGDIFLDVRYAGHQAREILTHGPVTLLLGVGVLLLAGRPSIGDTSQAPRLARRVAAALWVAIPIWLAAVALSGDVMEEGQSEHGLAAMVAAHTFEHVLDYLLVLFLLTGIVARATFGIAPSDSRTPAPHEDRIDAHH